MIVHLVDNISYARELFIKNKHTEKLGEHVIEKDVLDTILSLLCTGYVPENVSVKIENNSSESIAELLFPKIHIGFYYFIYEKKLASYILIKNCKVKIKENKFIMSNINITSLLKLISSGTCYTNVYSRGNKYVLKY